MYFRGHSQAIQGILAAPATWAFPAVLLILSAAVLWLLFGAYQTNFLALCLAQMAFILHVTRRGPSLFAVLLLGHVIVFMLPRAVYFSQGMWNADRLLELRTLYLVTLVTGTSFVAFTAIAKRIFSRPYDSHVPRGLSPLLMVGLWLAWVLLWWFPAASPLKMLGLRLQGLALCALFLFESSDEDRTGRSARNLAMCVAFIDFSITATLFVAMSIVPLWLLRLVLLAKARELPVFGLFVLAMFFCQGIKAPLRARLWGRVQSSVISERFETRAKAIRESMRTTRQTDTSLRQKSIIAFLRINDDSLEKVLSKTPVSVPYWRGESYEPLKYAFIPHLFWNEKPSRDIWHRFGKRYGYLGGEDRYTSVTLNTFAEGYMNFGKKGLVITALLTGLVLVLLDGLVERLGVLRLFSFGALASLLLFPNDTVSTVTNLIVMAGALYSLRLIIDHWRSPGYSMPRLFVFFAGAILLLV